MSAFMDGLEDWPPDNTSGFGRAWRPGEEAVPLAPRPPLQPQEPRQQFGHYKGMIGGPYCRIDRVWLLGEDERQRRQQQGIVPGAVIGQR